MNSDSMGKKIREYRSKQGWSIEECSEKIGISAQYLGNIERGNKVPQLKTFIKMLNVLDASADDVLQDSLTVGYKNKSNDLLSKIEELDVEHKRQAIEIFESVISILKNSKNTL